MNASPAPDFETAVAIIGVAGRFPGARDVDAFWENIAAGVRSIRALSDEELAAAGVDPRRSGDPHYVKAAATIDGVELFDAAFFGYPPREAELIDPQHRLFLECVWEALEDAAYAPNAYNGQIGVFAGSAPSTYASDRPAIESDPQSTAPYYLAMHNAADALPSTVSYKLNLVGPSVAVQTFCSTSLVAAHLACQSLLTYECSLALAGGAVILIPQRAGYMYHADGIASPDGRCRPFDRRAQGSVMGNGVGVVVLKRMEQALADGDHIYAVIRGSAVNNDGLRKVGYTAPGLPGQVAAITTALRRAGVRPGSIGYIEAHGTGTALGDSVELDAMTQAFGQSTAKRSCAIGSVKANIGHLDRAAGVAGLIKTALALEHKLLPPSIEFESASPDAGFENRPFYVNTTLRAWPAGAAPRRAGVSAFGAGGTNAHMILEEAPPPPPASGSRESQLLVLSAKTDTALEAMTANLAAYLRRHPDLDLANVSWTLMVGRSVFNHRRALVCRDVVEAAALLESRDPARVMTRHEVHRRRAASFLFADCEERPMRSDALYASEPAYRTAADGCRAIAGADPERTAPFALQYALAMLLMSWGIRPQAVMGSGMAECVAACIAGALPLSQALLLASGRLPAGAVSLAAPQIPLISGRTGSSFDPAHVADPIRWTERADGRSRAETALKLLLGYEQHVVIEIGPPSEIGALARTLGSGAGDDPAVVESLPGRAFAQLDLERVLRAVGRLWLADVAVDWSALHGAKRRRVRLPSYPFERQGHWRPDPKPAWARPDLASERKTDPGEWFYLPSWKRTAAIRDAGSTRHRWLIFVDECGVGTRLAGWLTARGHSVVTVAADGNRSSGDRTVRPAVSADYETLLQELARAGGVPDRIVHLWMVSDPQGAGDEGDELLDRATDLGFASLVALTQALTSAGVAACDITVISTGVQDVDAADRLNPSKATVLGALKVIPQECAGLRCRSIDIAPCADDEAKVTLVERLAGELAAEPAGDVIALRGAHRWEQSFEPVRVPTPEAPRLRHGGVYLITGGLGGIGLAMAEHLAGSFGARLALVGRSPLPPRDEWARLLATRAPDDPAARRVRIVQALEARGTELLVLQADVSVPYRIRAAVERTLERFGAIHGVLHAAGNPGQGIIALKSKQAVANVFAPKVHGTIALARALEGVSLDFLVLFSSITSVIGGPGQADYAAANNFLEAFARRYRNQHGGTIAISWGEWLWDSWQDGLLGFPVDVREALVAHRRTYGIGFEEGADALGRLLAAGSPHAYVATFDLPRLVEETSRGFLARIVDGSSRVRAVAPRPSLGHSFIEPRNQLEERIAAIWQDVLGIAPIGIDDSFFELGGNSLLGVGVTTRLRNTLAAEIGVQRLYESPTVRTLAEHLQGQDVGDADRVAQEWRSRSEKRRERFRQSGSPA